MRLACTRHLDDLKHGPKRSLRWNAARAQHAIDFFPRFLRLAEGVHAEQPFELEPWQKFIVGSLFGWLGADGFRRFRTAYIEIGKGNGKTPMAAGIGLYGLVFDEEAGAEVYMAAVKKDQARIAFLDAKKMAEASSLQRYLEIGEHNIAFVRTRSFLRPVSSEARSMDGLRVHVAIVDEIHEHPTAMVIDKMRAGTKGRRQALIVEITNSGYDRQSVCWQHHDLSIRVLEGVVENDSWFAYVAQLDPCEACRAAGQDAPQDSCEDCDDWTDESVWVKANPNLDVSVTRKYLREQVDEALQMPSKRNLVLRLNFCRWTESITRWLSVEAWQACVGAVNRQALHGRRCYAGLDLSSTTDLTALALLFPDDAGGYDELIWYWLPKENLRARVERDRVPYDLWAREEFITLTEGNVVDYEYIRQVVKELALEFQLVELGYDPWNATGVVLAMQDDGATVVPVRQGFMSLSAPTKELEKLVLGRQLRHGGHPVLAWNAANAVVRHDPAGNVKLDKSKATERIDGIAATVTALARAMLGGGAQPIPMVTAL